MNFVKPVGYNLKTPTTYDAQLEIVENSNRNANATLIREIIANKTKLVMTWNVMDADEMSVLATLRKLESFNCDYYDPETQTYKTITCYCGQISRTPKRTGNGMVTLWGEITANFIEL